MTARWILILSGLLLTLWAPTVSIGAMRVQIVLILLLAAANFYLQAQVLRRRPVPDAVVYGASAADIMAITLIVWTQGGFGASAFVFFLPAILAYLVAFPALVTFVYTAAIMMSFVMLVPVSALSGNELDGQTLMARLIMFAAVATCGAIFRRIEHNRRAAVAEADGALDQRLHAQPYPEPPQPVGQVTEEQTNANG